MSLAPRVVIVHRRTELTELINRHGTVGQVGFFLAGRGRDVAGVSDRDRAVQDALVAVTGAIPLDWRQGLLERGDLDRFLFAPEDIVVVVGQDGLVANVAKYLDGQPVIGIDPEPGRNPGVLVRYAPDHVATLLRATATGRAVTEQRTMVEAVSDDGQRLRALNEIYFGAPTHQTARYLLHTDDGRQEAQASSGLIVATGTGATGWCRSIRQERHSRLPVPDPTSTDLAWFVREAWPSPATGTSCTQGLLADAQLRVTVESDRLVVFGDGMESDALTPGWGQQVVIKRAERRLALVTGCRD